MTFVGGVTRLLISNPASAAPPTELSVTMALLEEKGCFEIDRDCTGVSGGPRDVMLLHFLSENTATCEVATWSPGANKR
jgi:hypothetical protein